jgi:hypothetical protein
MSSRPDSKHFTWGRLWCSYHIWYHYTRADSSIFLRNKPLSAFYEFPTKDLIWRIRGELEGNTISTRTCAAVGLIRELWNHYSCRRQVDGAAPSHTFTLGCVRRNIRTYTSSKKHADLLCLLICPGSTPIWALRLTHLPLYPSTLGYLSPYLLLHDVDARCGHTARSHHYSWVGCRLSLIVILLKKLN